MRCGTALLALSVALLATTGVRAQDRNADAELEALIPDSAIDRPQDWVTAHAPAQGGAVLEEIVATSPLAEMPEIALPWPDDDVGLPTLASLDPEPDLAATVQPHPEALEVASATTDPAMTQAPQGDVVRVSDTLALVFPVDPAAFPERAAFEERFRSLSALVTLEGSEGGNIAQIAVRARTDRDLLTRLLRVYGYYDSDVIQTIGGIEPGAESASGQVRVRFAIRPGTRYRFGAIALGDLSATGADYPDIRRSFALDKGDPVNSDQIVTQRDNLDRALGESGYAFATIGAPDLLIDHLREEGDLTLPVATGGKYRFGPIASSLPDFLSGDHLSEIARFEIGDPYKHSEVDDLTRAILATGLVSSATVKPRETRAPAGEQPGEVALDVTIAKAPLRTLAGAIGYDSGDGFRLEGSWEHRNLFPPEGMLRVRGIAGTKEQLAGATFRRNNFRGRDQVLTIDAYASNVTRTAYAARTIALTGTFEKLTTLIFQKPWVWSVGAELLATNEREAEVAGTSNARSTYFIGALPLRAAYDGSDDLLDPSRGFRAALRVSPELSVDAGKRSTYARIQFDGSAYLPATQGVVVAGRMRLGSIPGTAIANIAPSRRFYAGGGGSVRGFGYQLIGPRNAAGDPSGGRSLTEFSLEARVKTGLMGGAVSVVPFVDAGTVNESPRPGFADMRYGAGLGIRYQTGFGPIRIDIGTPLNRRSGESRVAVYVALGQAF